MRDYRLYAAYSVLSTAQLSIKTAFTNPSVLADF